MTKEFWIKWALIILPGPITWFVLYVNDPATFNYNNFWYCVFGGIGGSLFGAYLGRKQEERERKNHELSIARSGEGETST